MTLRIQDPKYPTAPSLHESLLEACKDAIKGGGAFAFVSQGGVSLLLRDSVFTGFAANNDFDLVVGIDEVTDTKALDALREAGGECGRLSIRVFHHDLPNIIFHPKFCWFRYERGGVLITGSGNLTARGLRKNWEAFTISVLAPEEIDEVEQQWVSWTTSHATWLKGLDDAQVIARAERNVTRFVRRGDGEAVTVTEEDAERDVDEITRGLAHADDAVLITEIPKGGRWKQANFKLEDYQDFFGVREGEEQRVLLHHVNTDGTVGPREDRRGVSVQSRNFRFELGAATGLAYPDPKHGRPVGVFLRVATRVFKYRLLMPDDRDYAIVFTFLASRNTEPAGHMRRARTDAGTLRQVWPDSPLWLNQ
jgi:hypothetical protein